MNVIEEQRWGEVDVHTWDDLSIHQWMCFRLVLMEAETEQEVSSIIVENSGVTIETLSEVQVQGVKLVHSPSVAQTKTEMVISIVVSERDYKSEMINYLPLYERKSHTFNEVLESYDREFRNTEQQLEVTERNIFLDTAIETLPIMERDLGIESVASLQYDQRREQIASRNRASFDQTTEESIKNVASAYGNGQIDIYETDVVGVYEIVFSGHGVPNNLDGLKEAINIIFPAHLGIEYTLAFNTWEINRALTWGDAAALNWTEFIMWTE